jgi:mitochondrial import receptor subunit TOM40
VSLELEARDTYLNHVLIYVQVFLQGNLDNDLQLSGRANYRFSPSLVTKVNAQFAPSGQSMVQLEADYVGADFTTNVKAMNPSILEGATTGIFIGSYLQAVTPRLSLGLEAVWQRAAGNEGPQTAVSYAARYRGSDWIASAQLLAQGGVQTTYWKRLSDKVEAGVDINLQFLGLSGSQGMMGGPENEGITTLGAKYDFRTSTFRGQVDSKGKVSCVLDKRISPPVMVTFAGELDHAKVCNHYECVATVANPSQNSARVGLAISLESAGEEFMEQQEKAAATGMEAPAPPF